MKRSNSGFAPLIILIAIAIVVIIVVAIVISSNQTPEPTVTMTASLSSTEPVKEGQPVTLVMQFENEDRNSHDISVVLDILPRITVYSGDDLLSDNQYDFVIDSGEPDETRELTVIGSLEEGVSSASYDIDLILYVDGEKVQEETLTLPIVS